VRSGSPSTTVMTVWCRMEMLGVGGSSTPSVVVIGGAGRPDLAAVAELAYWTLHAKGAGRRLVIGYLAPDLADLLDLVGLSAEVQGKTEGWEEAHGVQRLQEEGELGDLPV